jgi:hypothetical protein
MTSTDGRNVTGAKATNTVQHLLGDRPHFHLGDEARWGALPGRLEAIRQVVREGDTTLEVRVGVSTVVFAACCARHTATSPDTGEHERVRTYCRRIGVDDSRLTFSVGLSEDVLPTLLGRERTLDVALIDRAHSFPAAVIDWYYATRSLKVGGKLPMDDIPAPAITQVLRHMRLEPNWRLDRICDSRAAPLTMLALPKAEDDWFDQPFNWGYPDFSFVRMPQRMRRRAAFRFGQFRHAVGEQRPGLRRLYKRTR